MKNIRYALPTREYMYMRTEPMCKDAPAVMHASTAWDFFGYFTALLPATTH